MEREVFFEVSKEQSLVKARIVEKYFGAWSKVIIPWAKKYDRKIAYIDLFAGPGRYNDGSKSTPLLILESAINNVDLSNMLVTIFNDKDNINTESLRKAINEIPGIERLKYYPVIKTGEVGAEILRRLEKLRSIPTLFFIDPWQNYG